MPKKKTLEEKLEVASSAVERALEARDKAIQDLMEAKIAYTTRARPKPGRLSETELTRWRARWWRNDRRTVSPTMFAICELLGAGVVATRRQPSRLADDRQLPL
jgi:hypothetical protein